MQEYLSNVINAEIPNDRKEVLNPFIKYIRELIVNNESIKLNFICTHNSRRSQLSQIWAQTAADYYGINAKAYSGGVEVTSFNPRAVACIERAGFYAEKLNGNNPIYTIKYSNAHDGIICFSKLFNDPHNEIQNFAAIMTCDHADEHCPIISGANKRLAVRYEDPKAFDDTKDESFQYDVRCLQIAQEMFHVFHKASQK